MSRNAPASLILLTAALCGSPFLSAHDLSAMAAGVLSHSDVARQAVHIRNQEVALEHVFLAQSLAAKIQTAGAHLPQPLFVPVRTPRVTTASYRERTVNGEFTANRMMPHTVAGAGVPRTTLGELDITTASDNLIAAYAAIQRQDWTSADADLAEIANLVVVDTSGYPLPLLQAHQNLEIARARVVNKQYGAAITPLRAAEHALSDFEQRDHGPFAQQAEDMRQSIEVMASHMNGAAAANQIDDWVYTLEGWENTRKTHLDPPPSW